MIPLVAIGLVTIVVASLVLITTSIQNQQELAEINLTQYEMYNEIAAETNNIKGMTTISGSIEFTNTQNEEIRIIQIRVYDDSGVYVESFDVDYVINGNNSIEIFSENLPIPLQGMLIQ